jgi:hypothetical protein
VLPRLACPAVLASVKRCQPEGLRFRHKKGLRINELVYRFLAEVSPAYPLLICDLY